MENWIVYLQLKDSDMDIPILAQQPCYHYGCYRKQPIPTPVRLESSAPIPELVLLPERNINGNKRTKNYRHKIELINEYGCICAGCCTVNEIEDLTLDHIYPKFMCPRKSYNIRQNWQLLCKKCHIIKSSLERLLIARITQKIIENLNNNIDIINIKEIIHEFKELIAGKLSLHRTPSIFMSKIIK